MSHARRIRFQVAAITAGLLAVVIGSLQAQPITVPNFSFESQQAPNTSPYVNINVASWQKIAEPSYYTPTFGSFGIPWVGTAGVFLDTFAGQTNSYANKDGSQLGYILAVPQSTLFQTLGTTFAAGESYNLTVGIFGKPNMAPGSTLVLSLFYLDSLNNMTPVNSTTVTYSAGAFTVTNPLNLVDFSVNVPTVQAGDPEVGKAIGIEMESTVSIQNTSFGNWDIDNVRLTASAVPEPATMSLLAVGLGGLLWGRARRRA